MSARVRTSVGVCRAEGRAEVESVFCLGFSCSVTIDNSLSMLSEMPLEGISMSYQLAYRTLSDRTETEVFVCRFPSDYYTQPESRLAHFCGTRANL